MAQFSLQPSHRFVRSTRLACVLAACAFAQLSCKNEEEKGGNENATGGTAETATGGTSSGATGGKSAGGATASGGTVGTAGTHEPGEGGSSNVGNVSAGGSPGTEGTTERTTFATNPSEFRLEGESLCSKGDFKICENFEKTAVGKIPDGWSFKKGASAGNIGVQNDKAARGDQSLRVDIAGGQHTVIAMIKRENLGDLAHRQYGRMFYRVQGPGFPESIHFDVMEADGPWQGHTNGVRFAATGYGAGTEYGNWAWIYNVQPFDPVGSEFVTRGDRSAHPRLDQWMCLEWFFDADAQEAQYYDDGKPIEYLHIDTERSEIPVFTNVAVGLQKFQQTAGLRAWVDEVAIDGERIGCNY